MLGFVPAMLSTRVIKTRSMFVLLSAAAMVKPPMSSMMVGENIIENTHLCDCDQPPIIHQTSQLTSSPQALTSVYRPRLLPGE